MTAGIGGEIGEYASVYERLAERIRGEIDDGRYVPGEKLPSANVLCARYGVSPVTMQRALSVLRKRGLLLRSPKRGTFVREVGRTREYPLIGAMLPGFKLPVGQLSEALAPVHFSVLNGLTQTAAALSMDIRTFVATSTRGPIPGIGDLEGAVILFGDKKSEPLLELAREFRFPVLCVALFMPEWRKRFLSVNWDNREGGRLIAERLAASGRRRVVFISTYKEQPDSHATGLMEGFREAAEKRGLSTRWRLAALSSEERADAETTRAATRALLRGVDVFDAIVVTDAKEAVVAREWAMGKGLLPPEDYALVAPDFHGGATLPPGTSSLKVPLWELGKVAAETMMALLNKRFVPRDGVWLAPSLTEFAADLKR